MPWGKKSTDHNTSGLSNQDKKHYNSTVAKINQEAKRRVQTQRKATNQDGNQGNR